jgi:hypothetical protein
MIRKKTWILLGIFVILVGAAIYLQKNPIKPNTALTPNPTAPAALLNGWTSADIQRIEYQDNLGSLITLAQVAQENWVLQPDNKPVGLGKIEQIRTQILDTQVVTALDPGYDLASIGINAPSQTLTLTSTKGTTATIRVGSKTAIGTGYYVQVNQEQPVVVNSYAVEGLLDALKKETLLDLTPTPQLTASPEVTATP